LAQFNVSEPGEKGLETVEIDPQYAQSLGLTQGDIVRQHISFYDVKLKLFKVEIGLIYDMAVARSVSTEPLTSDDWDIIVSQFTFHTGCVFIDYPGDSRVSRRINSAFSSAHRKSGARNQCMGIG
jgi:hypothetical protein